MLNIFNWVNSWNLFLFNVYTTNWKHSYSIFPTVELSLAAVHIFRFATESFYRWLSEKDIIQYSILSVSSIPHPSTFFGQQIMIRLSCWISLIFNFRETDNCFCQSIWLTILLGIHDYQCLNICFHYLLQQIQFYEEGVCTWRSISNLWQICLW